jgi:DNA-binding NarL/FixJ family response regulator
MAISLTKLLLEIESSFPDEGQLLVMKGVMDGISLSDIAYELGVKVKDAKQALAIGMQKAKVNNLYELIVWGLRAGIIQDEPKTDLKDKIQPAAGTYEAHPTWLRVLEAMILGYSDNEIDKQAGINRDSIEYYKKMISDKFGLNGSRAKLIRLGFSMLNPITANPSIKAVRPPEEPKPEPVPEPEKPNIVAVPEPEKPPTGKPSVVVVDEPLVIRGISDLLSKLGYELVGTAENGVDAMSEVYELKPDVLIMEVALPMKNGIAVARELRDRFPNTKIVMYTGYSDKKYLHAALAVGADAYVMKTSQVSELKTALKRVLNGEMYVDRELRKELTSLRHSTDRTPFETLTPQQLQVLQLIAESYNTKTIADIMKLSPKTVEYHRAELMSALNIWDVAGLVRYALKHGVTRMSENRKK